MKRKVNAAPIGVAVVGLGRAGGEAHLVELARHPEKFKIVGVMDALPERSASAAGTYGCRAWDHFERLLEDPAIELVSIATRSVDHFAHAAMVLKAGKAAFVEKPMCIQHRDAKKLAALSEKTQRPLYVRHNRRFEPAFRHLRDIMASGVLGQVFEVKMRRFNYQRRDDWQTLSRFGGGQLLNWGTHIMDHALCVLEAPVVGLWSNLRQTVAAGDAEDHVRIILQGANGRIVDLGISGGAALPDDEFLLLGDRGALRINGDTFHLRYIDPKQKLGRLQASEATPLSGHGFGTRSEKLQWIEKRGAVDERYRTEGMAIIWDHVFAAMRLGKPYPISLEQVVEGLRLLDAARRGTRWDRTRPNKKIKK
jgi:predicted dehydrogenase